MAESTLLPTLGNPRKFPRNSAAADSWLNTQHPLRIIVPLSMNADSRNAYETHAFMRRCIGLRTTTDE